jgi:signal transduction histidine kinase
VLYSSAKNVFQLLENLLQWSRSQRGKLEFNPGKIELDKVLSGVIGLLKENAEAKNIELSVILQPEDMIVFADRQMLETILRNLISNAIKFTNKGGVIQIDALQNEKEAILKVTDNGVGIAPEIKGRLFKIDSHQSLPGTENEKGTGLGLMLVREFVARHGGEIGVESRVGSGSTFYFTLPFHG